MIYPNAQYFIDHYGNQAYHKACDFTIIAVRLNDRQMSRACSVAARELMRSGYRKFPREEHLCPESTVDTPVDGRKEPSNT